MRKSFDAVAQGLGTTGGSGVPGGLGADGATPGGVTRTFASTRSRIDDKVNRDGMLKFTGGATAGVVGADAADPAAGAAAGAAVGAVGVPSYDPYWR